MARGLLDGRGMRVVAATLPVLALALGCASTHHERTEPSSDEGSASAPGVVARDAVAPITWSIPEHQQPPLLDGAAQVLTSVAQSRFDAVVGRFLAGSPRVYEGALAIDAGELGAVPRSEVTLVSTIFPNLYFRGVTLDRVHVMHLRGIDGALVLQLFQETSEAELGPEWLSAEGHGSAWLDVSVPGAADAVVWGRCFECMTVLEEAPVAQIELRVASLDPADGPPRSAHVEGELAYVPPELLTPPILERATRSEHDFEVPELRELTEREPGLWQREHLDRTYLRCKEGGSRLVDFRTTWTLEEGAPERSGIGPIEVTAAGACEAFDYGGGS